MSNFEKVKSVFEKGPKSTQETNQDRLSQKSLFKVCHSEDFTLFFKMRHEKSMAEPNKIISKLMEQITVLTETSEKDKEDLKKVHAEYIQAKCYQEKFSQVCAEGGKLAEQISNLKLNIEEKSKEIENIKAISKKKLDEKEEEINKMNEQSKEVQTYLQNQIKAKEQEIKGIYIKIEEMKDLTSNEKEKELIKAQRELEEDKRILEDELQTQNGKLLTIAEAYKSLKMKFDNANEDYEKKLQLAQNLKSENQASNQLLNEELAKLKKINNESTSKLNDALTYIKNIQGENEDLKKEIDAIKNEHKGTVGVLKTKPNNTLTSHTALEGINEIISEYMLYLYKQDHSIAYCDLIERTLFNFNQITQATFDLIAIPGSIGIIHENLKDIYFIIYSMAATDNAEISGNNVSNEKAISIANEIFNKNFLVSMEQKRTIEEYIGKVSSLSLDEETQKEISTSFDSKCKKYQKCVQNSIKALVDKCLNTIKNGCIEINNKKIFSFKSFLNSKTFIKDGRLIIGNSELAEESTNYLINLIKYPRESINAIEMKGQFLSSKISDKSIKKIFFHLATYLSSVETFILTNCDLKTNIMTYLAFMLENMKQLVSIRLVSNIMTDDNIKMMSDILKNSKMLKELHMNKSNITSSGAFFLADCLTLNKTIKQLSLSSNKITGDGLQTLFNVICTENSPIDTIDLSNNNFKDEDFFTISNCLEKNPKIISLSLNDNTIELPCCFSVGTAISEAANLKVLNLSNMVIYSDYTPSLFINLNIEELIIDNNPLEEIGHIMLAKALYSNMNFKKLSMKNTKISSIGLTHILNCINTKKKFEEIHLENNDLDDNCLTIIVSLVKDKTYIVYISARDVTTQKHKGLFGKLKNVILV